MRAYCGIDPGREKFGLALCDYDEIFFSAIAPAESMTEALCAAASGELGALAPWRVEGDAPLSPPEIMGVFLGDGTASGAFARALEDMKISFTVVDERMTTLEARGLYWTLHPPKFPWSLLPLSLRVPPRPLDDLAAWAIVRKALYAGR